VERWGISTRIIQGTMAARDKKIASIVIEVMMAELTPSSWWTDLAATRHITRGLIESRDAIFLEDTDQITSMDEIGLLQGKDYQCLAPQHTSLEDER